jgi:hypothetical protein
MRGLRFTMPKIWHDMMLQLIASGSFCTMADCMRSLFREGQVIATKEYKASIGCKQDLPFWGAIDLNEHPTTVNLSAEDWEYFKAFDLYPKYIINLCFYCALKKRKLLKKG